MLLVIDIKRPGEGEKDSTSTHRKGQNRIKQGQIGLNRVNRTKKGPNRASED